MATIFTPSGPMSVSATPFSGSSSSSSGSGGGGSGSFQGPTRPETDVEVFRATGQSLPSGSADALRIRQELISKANAQRTSQAKALASQASAQRQQALIEQRKKDIILKASGGVETGGHTFIGKAVVPDTGMTANQYRRFLQQQALKRGDVKPKDIGKVGFRVSRGTSKQETITTNELPPQKLSGVNDKVTIPTNLNSLGLGFPTGRGTIQTPTYDSSKNIQTYISPTLLKEDNKYYFIEPPKKDGVIYPKKEVVPKYSSKKGSYGLGATRDFNVEGYEPIKLPVSGTGELIAGGENINLFTGKKKSPISPKLGVIYDIDVAGRRGARKVISGVGSGITKASDVTAEKVSSGLQFIETKTGYDLPTSIQEYESKATKAEDILKSQGKWNVGYSALFGTTGFGVGVAKDIRQHPVKGGSLYATGGIITGGSKALMKLGGYFGKKVGLYSGGKRLAKLYEKKAIKGTTYSLYGTGAVLTGGYAIKTGAEFIATPTAFEKGGVLGKAGTELAFLGAGSKTVSYGTRRYGLYKDIKTYADKLPAVKKAEFYKAFKEAKGLRGIKPEVGSLDLTRLQLIEKNPKAQNLLKDYFASNKDLIVGGSISQQSQFSKGISGTKRPGDIDLYVKRFGGFGEAKKGQSYARDIAKQLRETGAEASARKGKVSVGGEKFIEFHPYKTFLRPNIEAVTPWYYPAGRAIRKTPEGANVLGLDIQAPRKVVGFYLEPVISGKNRLKDLPAYETIKESLSKTKRGDILTPSETALLLEKKGKITFQETKLLSEGTLGEIQFRGEKPLIKISPRYRPSELLAFGFEKSKAKKGFGLKEFETNLGKIDSIKKSIKRKDLKTDTLSIIGEETKPKGGVSGGKGGGYRSYKSSVETIYPYKKTPITSYTGVPSITKYKGVPFVITNIPYIPTKTRTPTTATPYTPTKITTPVLTTSYTPTKITTPVTTPYTPTNYPSQPTTIITTKEPIGFFKIQGQKQPKQKRTGIKIYGRRFGKWKSIGLARTSRGAIVKGKDWASKTLGVSFKIGSKTKPFKLTNFRTKKSKKEGLIYIEKRGKRLKKRGSEVREIQLYKNLNRGKLK